jgi:hypothetical protein
MISVSKYTTILVLLQLLAGRSLTSYVYYTYRRVFVPDTFRLNFAYQNYFKHKFHKNEYTLKMFFRNNKDMDVHHDSPLIIELGFSLYFLLMLMRNHMMLDMDEKFYNRLITLIPNKEKAASTRSKNIAWTIIDFFTDLYLLCTRC